MKLPPSADCRRRFTFVNRHQFPIFKKQKILASGADRDRTCDLFSASEALSQLSYSPRFIIYFGPSVFTDSEYFLEAKFKGAFTNSSTEIIVNIEPVVG